jgi:hypothetical protein
MQTHAVETHLFVHELLARDFSLGGPQLQNGWPGARGFRDFSRLPPAQENRGQPADPAPAETHLISWLNLRGEFHGNG